MRLILLLILFISTINATTIELSKNVSTLSVKEFQYLKDDNYKLADLKNKNFSTLKREEGELFRFPFDKEQKYWVKLDLQNTSGEKLEKIIHIDVPDIRSVKFYECNKESGEFENLGRALHKQRTFAYKVMLDANEETTVLIYIHNYLAPTIFNLDIYDNEDFILTEQNVKLIHGLFLGAMAFAAIYFIVASIVMEKAYYSFYIIHILALTAFQFFVQGYGKLYLPEFTLLDEMKVSFGGISFVSFTLFVLLFLKDSLLKIYKRFFLGISLFVLVGSILFILKIVPSQPVAGLFLIGYISIAVASFDTYRRGNFYGLQIFISSVVIVLGAVIHAVSIIFQLIPTTMFTLYILSISGIIEVFIILLTFMIYLKRTTREKEKILLEKIAIQSSFSDKLQIEVDEKTAELKEINKNLNTRVEEAVTKSQEQERLIFFQSKLATMGETINIIAHQWKQPLSIVSSYLSSLQISLQYEEKVDKDSFLKSIGKAQQAIKHLSSTINLFQSYLKPTKADKKAFFDLNEVLDNALDIYQPVMKDRNIDVDVYNEADLEVEGNREYLIQVIMIILSNARDLFIEKDKQDAYIRIDTKKLSSSYQLSIEDNGGGITLEPIERVFDTYTSTKDKQNSGLGLSIAKNIMTNIFKGDLLVENREKGACFILEIPKSES